jgi:hypothetical protein
MNIKINKGLILENFFSNFSKKLEKIELTENKKSDIQEEYSNEMVFYKNKDIFQLSIKKSNECQRNILKKYKVDTQEEYLIYDPIYDIFLSYYPDFKGKYFLCEYSPTGVLNNVINIVSKNEVQDSVKKHIVLRKE